MKIRHAGEVGKREKRVFLVQQKMTCWLSYSYITKVCISLEIYFMILEAGLSILLIKEASKMGFSISCTTSHHCNSWQGREKRDEKLRTVYHPRLVIYVESPFYPFYPQISPPFNTIGTFTVFHRVLLILPTLFLIFRDR